MESYFIWVEFNQVERKVLTSWGQYYKPVLALIYKSVKIGSGAVVKYKSNIS